MFHWAILRLSIIGVLLVSLLLAAACAGNDDGANSADGAVRAATSLELFADMVRNVGGDRVEVEALLPSGADPHTFELAPGRVRTVAEADIVFINGLGLEESIADVVTTNAGGPVIELADGLPVISGEEDHEVHEDEADHEGEEEHEQAEGNPHLWLDAQLAMRYVERIRDALIDLDPEGRTTYETNTASYLDQLGALDREIEEAVQSIPPDNRKLVTFHDAFPYFASRYGLEVTAVVVPSPGQEPSARDVAQLTETLTGEQVPAVFREPQFDNAILEQAADEAGIDVLELLSGSFIEGVDSYTELMRFNMEQIVEGLGGD